MTQLFVRIELQGNPVHVVHQSLDRFMLVRHWYPAIGFSRLPPDTYQAVHPSNAPDIRKLANQLRTEIEREIWKNTSVLVIRADSWAASSATEQQGSKEGRRVSAIFNTNSVREMA